MRIVVMLEADTHKRVGSGIGKQDMDAVVRPVV